MGEMVVRVGRRGAITVPKRLREAYGIQPGDTFRVVDRNGVLALLPTRSGVDELADAIGTALAAQGETLESMLEALREERARYAA